MPAPASHSSAPEEARATLAAFVEQHRLPGLSIAVVDRDGPLFIAGVGRRNLTTGALATPETTYLWFSLTKIVTATAAVRLAEDDVLDLDAPVAQYVPAAGRGNPRATVAQLLNHTAGYANPAPVRWVRLADRPPSDDDLLERLLRKHGKPRHEPGGAARYSNLGYLVLGTVIEAAAGTPFTTYVHDTILSPLGMDGTDFTHVDPDLAATGYLKAPRAVTPALRMALPRGVVGAQIGRYQAFEPFYVEGPSYGGLVGGVVDAGQFASAHLGDGAAGAVRILRPDTATRMRSIDTPGKHVDLGQGWYRQAANRRSAPAHVEHLGGGGGFYNVMRLYPDEGLGFVVMTNTTRAYPHHQLLDRLVRLPWTSSDIRGADTTQFP